MFNQLLMLYLTLAGLGVFYLLANKNRWGWALSVINQFAWLVLAYRLHSWGFLLGAFAFGAIAIHGWFKWRPPPSYRHHKRELLGFLYGTPAYKLDCVYSEETYGYVERGSDDSSPTVEQAIREAAGRSNGC